MANEFYYCVSLSIVHPSVDPSDITRAISELRPLIQAKAGADKLGKDGKPLAIPRKVLLSHWLADLHQGKLHSGSIPLNDFLLGGVRLLNRHSSLFARLREEGRVALIVGLFAITNHSAAVLDAELLKECGNLGIDLELDYYGVRITEDQQG